MSKQQATVVFLNDYRPDHLLDRVMEVLEAKNDAALAQMLKLGPPMISKIRNRKMPVTASVLVCMHEHTGLEIKHLREWMGDRRDFFQPFTITEN